MTFPIAQSVVAAAVPDKKASIRILADVGRLWDIPARPYNSRTDVGFCVRFSPDDVPASMTPTAAVNEILKDLATRGLKDAKVLTITGHGKRTLYWIGVLFT